ncbi:hypothetical protein EJ074_05770 [Mesorhizobium sp. M3A.F.Ca.ET.080.04.2.1]|nr:hypothetical protein EJ074_05770 [Mesorhizobium sp. M3A.F.Ca.ET.080.04.2.1]RWE28444.1 MAG: hypothetical protein EOS77_26080 [Mesorhizobium sp.]
MALADEIRMVERHVELGERHISRQLGLIRHLDHEGLPVTQAMEFLHLLEDMQALHRLHLSRLLRKAGGQ